MWPSICVASFSLHCGVRGHRHLANRAHESAVLKAPVCAASFLRHPGSGFVLPRTRLCVWQCLSHTSCRPTHRVASHARVPIGSCALDLMWVYAVGPCSHT